MIVQLQELKIYLGINNDTQDALLNILLEQADSFVKNYTGREFESKTYNHIFNGKGEQELLLKQFPVTELIDFQYNTGSIGNPSYKDFNIDSYKLEPEIGKIWTLFFLPKGIQNIKVQYIAGFSNEDMPGDIKNVILKLAAGDYNKSKSDGIKSESVDGASLVYDQEGIPKDILYVLNKYKNVSSF